MTFEEFQTTCDAVVSTQTPNRLPCPITIGDPAAEPKSSLGDGPSHNLLVYRMVPDSEALKAIYSSVAFSFDSGTNEVVIAPKTTGA